MEGVRMIGIPDLDPLKKSCTLTDIGNVVDNTRVKNSLRSRHGCSLVAYSISISIFCLSGQRVTRLFFLNTCYPPGHAEQRRWNVEESRGTPSLVEGSVKQDRRHRTPSFALVLLVMRDQKYLIPVRDAVPSVRASLYIHSIFGQARRSFKRSISFLPVETVSNMVGDLPSSTRVGISNGSLDVDIMRTPR